MLIALRNRFSAAVSNQYLIPLKSSICYPSQFVAESGEFLPAMFETNVG